MKMSKMYMPTLKENPSEAEIESHKLLLRAGMIRQLVSGVYSYLPLGYRAIQKVEEVVREEMDKSGSQELLMSAIQPKEIWEATGRWENFGPEMWRLTDRNNREFCLGPTHEEYFTDLIKNEIKSYKQLPLNLYQIQTKYRDEKRPRFGLMRGREFIMKDAYSFDVDQEGMENSYQEMWDAYDRIFTRLKLNYKVVEGDTGAMGGRVSHEFMAISEAGEGLIAYCDSCDYAATDEKAIVIYDNEKANGEILDREDVYTENISTIEALVEFFDIKENNFGKAIVYNVSGKPLVVIIPGDRELNETKLFNYLQVPEHEIEMADEDLIKGISGADKGYTGPIGLKENTRLIIDKSISQMKNIIVGANKSNYHIKNANYGRDFEGEIVDDLLMVVSGDKCPKCNSKLKMEKGIEVGNIFQLGTKYSEGLNGKFLDKNGKEQLFVMGSYGIGITRTVAAIVEQNNDENGIVWPLNTAPYQAIISILNVKKEEQVELGERLYDMLKDLGVEVLLDNRDERAGVKFKDRDLIGIPIRITVGKKADEEIVEYSLRSSEEKMEVSIGEIEDLIVEEFQKNSLKLR